MKYKFFLSFLLCVSTAVYAQTIKLVVPFSAGGVYDRVARSMEKTLVNKLPYNFIVEYQLGAAGIIAANNVAKIHSKETVLLMHGAPIATNTFNPSSTYDLFKDFVYVANLGAVPMILITSRQSGIVTAKQLRQTNSSMFYATSGVGSANHIAGEILQQQLNKDLTPVFYKGESAAITDVMSGTVPMMFVSASVGTSYTTSAQPSVVAITGTHRNSALPNVPTFAEQGIRGFERSTNWVVLLANPGADPEIVAKIKTALAESFSQAQDQELYRRAGIEPNAQPLANMREFLLEEVERVRPFRAKLKQ